MRSSQSSAIILAGGDGLRLRSLTRAIADFSKVVLTPSAAKLAVLPVTGVEWNDLGDPGRVGATRRRMDQQLAMA